MAGTSKICPHQYATYRNRRCSVSCRRYMLLLKHMSPKRKSSIIVTRSNAPMPCWFCFAVANMTDTTYCTALSLSSLWNNDPRLASNQNIVEEQHAQHNARTTAFWLASMSRHRSMACATGRIIHRDVTPSMHLLLYGRSLISLLVPPCVCFWGTLMSACHYICISARASRRATKIYPN